MIAAKARKDKVSNGLSAAVAAEIAAEAPHEIGENRQNGTADNKDGSNKNGLGVSPLFSIRSSCVTIVRYTPRRRVSRRRELLPQPEAAGAPRAEVGAGRAQLQQPTTVRESIVSSHQRKRVVTRCGPGVWLTALAGRQYGGVNAE